jgi:hypothetical protein
VCNLYSLTKGQQAIRDMARAIRDLTGNLPLFPNVFPDYTAPIVRNAPTACASCQRRAGACRHRHSRLRTDPTLVLSSPVPITGTADVRSGYGGYGRYAMFGNE